MSPLDAVVLGVEIVKAIMPILPGLERLFRDVWPRTEDFDDAWQYAAPLVPSSLRAPIRTVLRAVWDTYETGELEAAWQAMKAKLEGGGHITRAGAPDFEAALEEQHHRADQLEGSPTADDAPATDPAPPPEHEFDPPHFDAGELGTSVEVPHPHEGQS